VGGPPVEDFHPDEPDDQYDVVKQEAGEAMEDAAPSGAVDLSRSTRQS
jgi:hypothetical protein